MKGESWVFDVGGGSPFSEGLLAPENKDQRFLSRGYWRESSEQSECPAYLPGCREGRYLQPEESPRLHAALFGAREWLDLKITER